MKNAKGASQNRGIRYEKKKVKDHGAKHLGGPGRVDGQKGGQKIEVKNWAKPVPRPELIKARRKGVNKFISKSGFTEPAQEYAKKGGMKLYKGKKKVV